MLQLYIAYNAKSVKKRSICYSNRVRNAIRIWMPLLNTMSDINTIYTSTMNSDKVNVSRKLAQKNDHRVWRAFYVKPRHEKAIRDRFIQAEFEVFCPTVNEKRRWADRWKMVERPILPGYILAYVNETERRIVLNDKAVVNSVFYLGKPAEVRTEEVLVLKEYLNKAISIQAEPLKPGMRIAITEGPLIGKSGEVDSVAGQDIFVLLESLQVQLRIKLAVDSVKKIVEGEQAR